MVGSEYGFEDSEGVSPTEREYDEATRLGLTRLVFVLEKNGGGRHPKIEKGSQKGSQKSSQKILDALRQNPNMSTTELAGQIGISRRAVAKHIAVLQASGALRRIGPDKGGHWEVVGE